MLPQGRRQTGLTVGPVALLKREHDMILEQRAMSDTAMSPRSAGRGVAKGVTSCEGVHFKQEEVLIASLQPILGWKQERQAQFQNFSFCSIFLSKGGREHGYNMG